MRPIIAVPATLALVYRAWSHKSLTPLGIVVAASTAVAHAVHPWNLPFALLVVFFLAGTRATKVKKDVKATLTMSAQGNTGGEGPRTHVQVLANSAMATVLALLHAYKLRQAASAATDNTQCFSMGRGGTNATIAGDVLAVGIIANYAAVAADTFSSELGILSRTQPRLITSWSLRKVPRGTNGGVTVWGLAAGLLGSVIVVTASTLFLPICSNTSTSVGSKMALFGGLAIWGALGSVLDSFLGGWFQRSVRDARTGKIIEGDGGVRVLVAPPPPSSPTKGGPSASRDGLTDHQNQVPSTDGSSGSDSTAVKNKRTADLKARLVKGEGKDAVEAVPAADGPHGPARIVETGHDFLDNNQVNFLMAFIMTVGGMAIAASAWGVPLGSVLSLRP